MSSGLPPLQFSAPSASDTGDVFNTPEFSVDFGDIIAGAGANAAPSYLGGIIREVAMGVAIAIAARYAWEALK